MSQVRHCVGCLVDGQSVHVRTERPCAVPAPCFWASEGSGCSHRNITLLLHRGEAKRAIPLGFEGIHDCCSVVLRGGLMRGGAARSSQCRPLLARDGAARSFSSRSPAASVQGSLSMAHGGEYIFLTVMITREDS